MEIWNETASPEALIIRAIFNKQYSEATSIHNAIRMMANNDDIAIYCCESF